MFLPGESQGWGSLVGCRLWGRIESDMTEAMQQQQQHDPVILLLGIYAEKTIIQKHQFFGVQPYLWFNSYICT